MVRGNPATGWGNSGRLGDATSLNTTSNLSLRKLSNDMLAPTGYCEKAVSLGLAFVKKCEVKSYLVNLNGCNCKVSALHLME